MDRVQGLGQALFAILTAEPCASLPKVRFNACPAQASDRPAVNSKDLLKTVLTAKWDPATSISSACFSTESTNPRQMLSTTPCSAQPLYKGEKTYWLAWACGLAGLGNFHAAAEAPYSAVQFSNCAELFCIWMKLLAMSPPPRRRAVGQ